MRGAAAAAPIHAATGLPTLRIGDSNPGKVDIAYRCVSKAEAADPASLSMPGSMCKPKAGGKKK